MFNLHTYQQKCVDMINKCWSSLTKYVILVVPTGGGKTVIFSHILQNEKKPSVVIAHRKEILSQISLALAKNEVDHKIIGPENFVRSVRTLHRAELGKCFVNPYARTTVASVDTLIARLEEHREWGESVALWVMDEAHHLLEENKWGKVVNIFPNARGLGVTATPLRGDGRSLKRGSGGLFENMVTGPNMRWLIDNGFLKDYRIFAPAQSIDTSQIKITGSGDYSPKGLSVAARSSRIVGDVVEAYLKFAPGELGATFAIDVQSAEEIRDSFIAAGVPAAILTAKSTIEERQKTIAAFKKRDLLQLINVDLLGEGFDLPAIQVVSMARPTKSLGLYRQQFGRLLRKFEGVTHGKLIDHVGNVIEHRLPDMFIDWSLDEGKPQSGEILPPLKTCIKCVKMWEGYARVCPHCGFSQPIQLRGTVEQVSGNLEEVDPGILKKMRASIHRVDAPVEDITRPLEMAGAPQAAILGLAAKHKKRSEAQADLRESMAVWASAIKTRGIEGDARYVRFYQEFGTDVLTAQALGAPDAIKLMEKIKEKI